MEQRDLEVSLGEGKILESITIVSGSDGAYKEIISQTTAVAGLCGYRPVIFDFGELGFGRPFTPPKWGKYTPRQAARWACMPVKYGKPLYMQTAMAEYGGPLVWIDADALLVQPIEDAFDHDYDIGVTFKVVDWPDAPSPRKLMFNSGVVFFQDTSKCRELFERWISETIDGPFRKSDQHHLAYLLKLENSEGFTEEDIGKTVVVDGVRVRFMEHKYNVCLKYMNQVENLPEDYRVLHFFRRGWQARWKRYNERI